MEIGVLNAALTSKKGFFNYFQDADVFERRKIVDELKELSTIYSRGLKKLFLKTVILILLYVFFLIHSNFLFWGTVLVMICALYSIVVTARCLKNRLIYLGLVEKCNRIWFENEKP
jgi:hypothetical protein